MNREARVIATEVHAGVLALCAAVLFARAGRDLWHAGDWRVPGVVLLVAAVAAAGAALLPWLVPALSLGWHRALTWTAWTAGSAVALAALAVLDLDALVASQLLLVAAALTELRGRPGVLLWFWVALALTGGVVVAYLVLAPVRPVPD